MALSRMTLLLEGLPSIRDIVRDHCRELAIRSECDRLKSKLPAVSFLAASARRVTGLKKKEG